MGVSRWVWMGEKGLVSSWTEGGWPAGFCNVKANLSPAEAKLKLGSAELSWAKLSEFIRSI